MTMNPDATFFALMQTGSEGGSLEWSLGYEGISPGWAVLVFVLLIAGTFLAYRKIVPTLTGWRQYTLIGLRACAVAVVLILLVKPVINLTLNEPVRQSLLVVLDTSQSMAFKDKRDHPDDLKRAALAAGILDPDKGLKQELPANAAADLGTLSRWDLLQKLAANEKLNLWARLAKQSDLAFFQFGSTVSAIGTPHVDGDAPLTAANAAEFFKSLHPDQPATAIGEAMRQVLQEGHGQPVGGILLITDGENNRGSPPLEAAQIAREQNVPLFIYGVGVTSPPDLILQEITPPKLAFVKERVDVHVKIRSQGIEDKTITATLKANGQEVDEQNVALGQEGEYEVVFHFIPGETGDLKLEASVPVLPQEVSKDNNIASATLRVTDSKFHVLLIEQEPRWDFRYLLAYLQRDRRLEVHCVMITGEPGLDQMENSPFLPSLPDDRDTFFHSEVLILGDVDPKDLGDDRMEIIREWVEAGGGIIFLAGPNFNPTAYAGTPLESLLPVVPDTTSSHDMAIQRAPEPFKLQLTPLGETSSYLQMSTDPEENKRIWDEFQGVRWTAPVARAKPGAEVLLVDPRPERAGRYGPLPVFAMQGYGAGTCVYLGTDETWRWRSQVGEKYYSILWGQIMESLSLQLLQGASSKTQLKTDRPQYVVGDKVIIDGNAYTDGFKPLIAPTLEGSLKIATTDASGKTAEQQQSFNLSPISGENGFHGDFVARIPGEYSYSTARDPAAILKFEVIDPRLEQLQTALNDKMLKAMANAAGGKFLREEDLDQLPKLLVEKASTAASFKKVELYYSLWWVVALLLFLSFEWLLRRLNQLK